MDLEGLVANPWTWAYLAAAAAFVAAWAWLHGREMRGWRRVARNVGLSVARRAPIVDRLPPMEGTFEGVPLRVRTRTPDIYTPQHIYIEAALADVGSRHALRIARQGRLRGSLGPPTGPFSEPAGAPSVATGFLTAEVRERLSGRARVQEVRMHDGTLRMAAVWPPENEVWRAEGRWHAAGGDPTAALREDLELFAWLKRRADAVSGA